MEQAPGEQQIPAIPLPEFEIDILNKVIHTRTFGEYNELKIKLQQLVEDRKGELIRSGEVPASDFPLHKTHVVNSMIQFLVRNEFYGVREGGVYFLTEKGKFLQEQGTIQKYLVWQMQREKKLIEELHTIEEKGYLEKDQTFKKEHHPVRPVVVEEDTKKNFGWYVLIIIVLIVLAAIGKSNKWW